MMNKRGLNYVDWIISLGTFLIAVLALFIFLRPGSEPEHTKEQLLDLVEEQFSSAANWEILKIPVYIHTLDDTYPVASGVQPVTLKITHASGWESSYFVPEPGSLNIASSTTSSVTISCLPSASCTHKKIFFYLYKTSSSVPHGFTATCTPSDITYCNVDVGSTELSKGYSSSALAALHSQDYTFVKQLWHYPLTQEFAVYLDLVPFFTGTLEPGSNAQVSARTFPYWYVNSTGGRQLVEVNIRVW